MSEAYEDNDPYEPGALWHNPDTGIAVRIAHVFEDVADVLSYGRGTAYVVIRSGGRMTQTIPVSLFIALYERPDKTSPPPSPEYLEQLRVPRQRTS